MKFYFLTVSLITMAIHFSSPSVYGASANRDGDLGLGVMIGDTTSITGKYWTSQVSGLELATGGSFRQDGWVTLSFNRHFLEAFGRGTRFISEMGPYIGLGLGAGFNRTIADQKYQADYFARLPLGIAWLPNRTPIDIFAEVAPTWDFYPTNITYLSGNVGARYYF